LIHSPALLDHHMVVDKEDVVYVVVGNEHPPGMVLAYPKYKPTYTRTLWCGKRGCYKRLLREYSVEEVVRVAEKIMRYDPVYGGVLNPYLPISQVKKVLDPRERLRKLFTKTEDYLELEALEAALTISECSGVNIEKIGLTGSLLLAVHNIRVSDIDLVVYGCRESLNVVETLNEGGCDFISPLKLSSLSEWLSNYPGNYNEAIQAVTYYRKWRRFQYRGREVSLIYVNPFPGRYGSHAWSRGGCVTVEARVSGGCRSLYYPSEAIVESYVVLEADEG